MRKIWCDKEGCKKEIKNGEKVIEVFGMDLCEDHGLTAKETLTRWVYPSSFKNKDKLTDEDCQACV